MKINIYCIENVVTGKKYIGQTRKSLLRRMHEHTINDHCSVLFRAIQKYGVNSFNIKLLLVAPSVEYANEIEQKLIQLYNTLAPNGYNLRLGGGVNSSHSSESRIKMSKSAKLRGFSEEIRLKGTEASRGRKKTDDELYKLSTANVALWENEEIRTKRLDGMKRYHATPGIKETQSERAKRAWETRRSNRLRIEGNGSNSGS